MYEAVITGLGPVAPNGVGKENFWEAISTGKSGIRLIDNLVNSDCPCQIGGDIPLEWVEERAALLPNWLPNAKGCKYTMLAAMLALEDAGLTPEDINGRNGAVFMGVSIPDMEIYQNEYKSFAANGSTRPESLAAAAPHTPATVVSHMLKIYSNVITVSTACTSGAVSIQNASEIICRGEADIVLAGGVEIPLSPIFISGFSSAGLVPTGYNDHPELGSRPFDYKRESGVLSEGAGVVVMEEKSKALRRNARIYATYSGGGFSTAMSPSWMKAAFFRAMSEALDKSRVKTSEIDHISASAPGHPVIDQVETEAIKDLFNSNAYNIPVNSLKSMIGNPGAAAGPLQLIASALSIQNCFITPTVNLDVCGEGCDLDYVPNNGRVARVNRAMINIRGFGGNVSSMIIARPI